MGETPGWLGVNIWGIFDGFRFFATQPDGLHRLLKGEVALGRPLRVDCRIDPSIAVQNRAIFCGDNPTRPNADSVNGESGDMAWDVGMIGNDAISCASRDVLCNSDVCGGNAAWAPFDNDSRAGRLVAGGQSALRHERAANPATHGYRCKTGIVRRTHH